METKMIIELIGYFGSLLVVISMLMTSVIKLRVINCIGSTIFAAYALIIQSYPTAIMNAFLVGINVYNLIKLLKSDKNYEKVDCSEEDSMIQFFLNKYVDDIGNFFPGFSMEAKGRTAYMICCGVNPVGILLGTLDENKEFHIDLDYTIPMYRDCSIGTFLFEKLEQEGKIKAAILDVPVAKHDEYLTKIGFEKTQTGYKKSFS